MPRYAIECEWNGAGYAGTSIQPDATTLTSLLQEMCARIEEPEAQWRCSSRLDAGVSAQALPAHVDVSRDWNCNDLGKALHAHAPDALSIRRIARVTEAWDSLRSKSVKHYEYRVLLRNWKPVLDTAVWHIKKLSHPERLQQMADAIIGEHDLSGFACLRGDETDQQDGTRRYHSSEWCNEYWQGGELWIYRISADGFLYRQVRGLVGTMLAVAQGSYPLEAFQEMLSKGKAAQRVGNIAPPQGLCLEQVVYEERPDWQELSWESGT